MVLARLDLDAAIELMVASGWVHGHELHGMGVI